MNQFDREEILRTVDVLKNQLGITSRDSFAHKLDDGADARDIEGIGEERAPIVAALWGLSEGDWVQWTGLPFHEPESPYESETEWLGQGRGEI